jgi:hypothetical protein
MMTKDPYIVLGIAWGATNEECVIRSRGSYRMLMQ